jgi:hypothetical protein
MGPYISAKTGAAVVNHSADPRPIAARSRTRVRYDCSLLLNTAPRSHRRALPHASSIGGVDHRCSAAGRPSARVLVCRGRLSSPVTITPARAERPLSGQGNNPPLRQIRQEWIADPQGVPETLLTYGKVRSMEKVRWLLKEVSGKLI